MWLCPRPGPMAHDMAGLCGHTCCSGRFKIHWLHTPMLAMRAAASAVGILLGVVIASATPAPPDPKKLLPTYQQLLNIATLLGRMARTWLPPWYGPWTWEPASVSVRVERLPCLLASWSVEHRVLASCLGRMCLRHGPGHTGHVMTRIVAAATGHWPGP